MRRILNFFTDPYKDEILYSVIARYHYYSGNNGIKNTYRELFGNSQISYSIINNSGLGKLCIMLDQYNKYHPEYFIEKHTLYPLIDPFLAEHRQKDIINEFKNGIGTKLPLMLTTLYKFQDLTVLKYCPKCAKEEIDAYGEAYFHRSHQVFGCIVCPIHGCLILDYPLKVTRRPDLIRLDKNNIDLSEEYELNTSLNTHYFRIARCIFSIVSKYPMGLNNEDIYKRYITLLNKYDYLDHNGKVKHDKIREHFIDYYGNNLLDILKSKLKEKSEQHEWLPRLTKKSNRNLIHPIRHILLILFLCRDFEQFINTEPYSFKPFGDGPWYCLNPVADHYKKKVVKDCSIKKGSKIIGYFTCSCGYTYRRNDPGNNSDELPNGRVVKFGHVWERKLHDLLTNKSHSLAELEREMSCRRATIIKYADKIGLRHLVKSKAKDKYNPPPSRTMDKDLFETHTNTVLDYMKANPECTRSEIQRTCNKQYAWLKKNATEWFEENMPKRSNYLRQNINWQKRDDEYYKELAVVIKGILEDEHKITRMTYSSIANRIGKNSIINHNLEKLPKTKGLLDSVCEDRLTYNLRKIDFWCKKLFNENGKFTRSEVLIKVGYEKKYIIEFNKRLEENFKKYMF